VCKLHLTENIVVVELVVFSKPVLHAFCVLVRQERRARSVLWDILDLLVHKALPEILVVLEILVNLEELETPVGLAYKNAVHCRPTLF